MAGKKAAFSTDALTSRRIGIDRFLTELSIGITADTVGFIGDQIFPVLFTNLSSEKIKKFGNEAFRMRDDLVGDFSEPELLDTKADKVTVEVEGHALMTPISNRQAKESLEGPAQINLETRNLYVVKSSMLLRREFLQATLAQAAAVYPTNKTDLNGVGFDTAIDPIDLINDIVTLELPKSCGKRPNVYWCNPDGWNAIQRNTAVKNRIFGTINPQGQVTEAQFASIIGVQKVVVGSAVTRDEATEAAAFVWGKNAGLVYVPPTAGQEVPAFGYTVEQQVFGQSSEAIVRIEAPEMGASGGYKMKRSHFYTPCSTFVAAGWLFQNCVV